MIGCLGLNCTTFHCLTTSMFDEAASVLETFVWSHWPPLFLQVTLYSYNWSVDLGASLNRELVRLVKWQNARSHVVHCLLNQKMGLFHHYCFSDAPVHDHKQVRLPTSEATHREHKRNRMLQL